MGFQPNGQGKFFNKKISMKAFLIISLCFFMSMQPLFAQYKHFTYSGTVEFEKTINMYALIKKQINKQNAGFMQSVYEQYRKTKPQFKKLKSILTFTSDNSLFKPIEEEDSANGFLNLDPLIQQNNTIYSDLIHVVTVTQKKVYEEIFLVKDSPRKINWKITDETREIAGYTCRRANAIIMDSVYVVAFYTDLIPVSIGPESFSGLQGMILGIALPHENITWFATKVNDSSVPPNSLTPPSKGRSVDKKTLETVLQATVNNWGNNARTSLKLFLL
jgi:GLPGLI family protein